jgi:uncharacterized protein (DUF2461 family)
MGFTGWTDRAYDVLLDLQGEPSPSQLHAHRDELELQVRRPMQELCDALNDKDGLGTFWMNSLSDKAYGWQHTWASWWIARRLRISFTFDLDGPVLGGGSSSPAPDQVQLYRKVVDAEDSGTELAGIVRRLERAGFELQGSLMRRIPSEYADDHPRADLLRRRGIYAEKPIETCDLAAIRKDLRLLRKLTAWYTDYVVTTGWVRP